MQRLKICQQCWETLTLNYSVTWNAEEESQELQKVLAVQGVVVLQSHH